METGPVLIEKIVGAGMGKFRCKCGAEFVTRRCDVRSGHVVSCGCVKVDAIREIGRANLRHGHCLSGQSSPTYKSWQGMIDRCQNPKSKDYLRYGSRGISVCERWMSFENFLTDMGNRPLGKTIDRVDNDGNYEPGNCRWATRLEQARNQRTNKRFEFCGRMLTTGEILEASNSSVLAQTFLWRIRRGKSMTECLSPVGRT